MTRYTAAAIHLALSLIVFVLLAYLVVYVWYPDFFFATDGGWQGIRIIVAVDLVLGPLLTLIVYRHGKPGLRLDLACIGVFQAVCLLAGVYIVQSERPLAMVYVDGRFSSVSADTFTEAGVALPDLSHLPGPWPKWVTVALPDDPEREAALRSSMFRGNRPLNTLHEYYVPFDPRAPDLVARSYPLDEVLERDSSTGALPQWLARHGGEAADYRFYPFGARYSYVFLGMTPDASMVDVLETPGPL